MRRGLGTEMLRDIAITPCVYRRDRDVSHWNAVALFMRDALRDCVVLNYRDGNWFQVVSQRLSGIPPEYARVIRALLSRMHDQNRLVLRSRMTPAPDTDAGWLEEALGIHYADPLFAVVATGATIRECPNTRPAQDQLIPFEMLCSSVRWVERSHERVVEREAGALIGALRPLFRRSQDVQIIDYKLLEVVACEGQNASRFVQFVRQCVAEWSLGVGPKRDFVVNSEMNRNAAGSLSHAVEVLRAALRVGDPPVGRIVLKCWCKSAERDFVRNRFAISEIAGVQVGKGFDPVTVGSRARQYDRVTLLSEEATREVLRDLRRCSCKHEFVLYDGQSVSETGTREGTAKT